jgi:E3 ubiquitin-protein ligase UHRF1
MVPPPISRKPVLTGVSETDKQVRRRARRTQMSVAERLLKGYLSFCYVYLRMPLVCGIEFVACLNSRYRESSLRTVFC